jgi:hypothetical protein
MLGCWFLTKEVEREFWKSDYCRRKLMMMERWGVVSLIVILIQKLVLGHPRKLLSNPRFDFWVFIMPTTLVVGTRAVLSLFLPDVFWQNRQVVHCQRAASRPAPACPRTQIHSSPPPLWPRRRRVILSGRILRLVHLVTGIMLGDFQRGYAHAVAQSTTTLRHFTYFTCIGALNAFLAPINAFIDFSLQVHARQCWCMRSRVTCSVRPAACVRAIVFN